MAHVRMYTTPYCPFCHAAKDLLAAKGVSFEEIDVDGKPEQRRRLREDTGQRTVPQIFIGDESIGGFDELSALERSGQLDAKLAG